MSDNTTDPTPDDEILEIEEVVEELDLPEPSEMLVESQTESVTVADPGAIPLPPPPPAMTSTPPPPAPTSAAPAFAATPPPPPPAPAQAYPPAPTQYAPMPAQAGVPTPPPPHEAPQPPGGALPPAPAQYAPASAPGQAAPPPPAPYSAPPASTPGYPPAPAQYGGGTVPAAPYGPAAPGGQAAPSPAAPTGPSAFGMALGNLWYSMNDIWRGKVPAAFARPKAVETATGNRWLNWFLPFLATSLMVGFTVSSAVARGASWFSMFFYGVFDDLYYDWVTESNQILFYDPGFGYYFRLFLYSVIVSFAFFVLRSLAVWLAALTSGVKADFPSSATVVGVAANLLWLPLVAATLLIWIFPATMMKIVLLVGLLGLALMAEITVYVGVTRLGRSVRSPLVPYVWYTVIAGIVTLLFGSLAFPMTL